MKLSSVSCLRPATLLALFFSLIPKASVRAGNLDWDAARDMRNNELRGSPQNSGNPNPSVTNWVYGYRREADIASTDLTLFASDQHFTTGGASPDLHGWFRGGGADGPAIEVNVGTQPIILNFCCGPLLPIGTNDVAVWPSNDGYAAVVRWVAPYTANYDISAYWRKTDINADGGCLSGVVADGNVLYSQVWFNADSPGYTNTVKLTAGTKVDFLLGPDGGYSFDGSRFNAKITLQNIGPLPAINSVSASAGVNPARSNNPWTFTATYGTLVSDLRLRVQSTLTPAVEGSWTDLPGNPYMTHLGDDWTLNTTDLPTGVRYFRVIAAAPAYSDGFSTVMGPFTVQDGIHPFGDFIWQTSAPFQPGVPWIFTISESATAPGLNLRVQSSTTPDKEDGWSDLPGTPNMTRSGSLWTLNTTNVPTGSRSFRVIASAATYVDRISGRIGPFEIAPPLPVVSKSYSSSGHYNLLDVEETQSPQEVYLLAVSEAVAEFNAGTLEGIVRLNAAIGFAAAQYAQSIMSVLPNQNVQVLALNAGPGALLELKGTLTGAVSLIGHDGASLLTQDGAGLLTQDGAGLAFDRSTSGLIGHDGVSLLTQDGAGLLTQDGAGLLTQDGAGLVGNAGSESHIGISAGAGGALAGTLSKPKGPLALQGVGTAQPTSTGVMTINGNFNQSAGTLYVAIAGTNTVSQGAQQFDQLVVNGTANLLGGNIIVGLFNPDDRNDRTATCQPPVGSTFDIIVATNIVTSSSFKVMSALWGEGLCFHWQVVTRQDGQQALRLIAAPFPARLRLVRAGADLQLSYPTNYVGYTIQSTLSLSSPNWQTVTTTTNILSINPSDPARFYRLIKPVPAN